MIDSPATRERRDRWVRAALDDVPQAAAEVWDLMPDRSGTEPKL